jgi:pyridoxal phosphate enzyme (YggS family)
MSFSIKENLHHFKKDLASNVTLLAVSKTKPVALLQEAYDAGQRDFGENKVQELRDKHPLLASDIRWHMIGHLQTNKVKYIAPFIYMIHSVDSIKLLEEINKRALSAGRKIRVLIQVHVAEEEEKFGFDMDEIRSLFSKEFIDSFPNIIFCGLMAMATFTEDKDQIRSEFMKVKKAFDTIKNKFPELTEFNELSMGMSNDYQIAIEEGSTMIRIGSSIFGSRK